MLHSNQQPESMPAAVQTSNVFPIEETNVELSPEEFRARYRDLARPLVLRGIARWVSNWSFERLRRDYGDTSVRASYGVAVDALDPEYRQATLSEIIDSVQSGGPKYLVLNHFATVFPAIGEDFERHGCFNRYFSDARLTYKYLWLNRPGHRSTFHQDGSFDNLNFMVAGRKRFALIAPSHWPSVYSVAFTRSHLNPFEPDYQKYPKFRDVVSFHAELGPGDVLYIPRYWWHNAYAVEPTINMNTFALMPGSGWRDSSHLPIGARVAVGVIRHYPNFWFRDSEGRITPVKQAIRRAVWLGSRVRMLGRSA